MAPAPPEARQAGASFGVLEAWGNPEAPSSLEAAFGGGIVPSNYWALGLGLGVATSPAP